MPGSAPAAARHSDAGADLGFRTIWVLTDRRYLKQRMPRAVLDWLVPHTKPRLIVADDDALVGRADRPSDGAPWKRMRSGDIVVARSRHPFALALLRMAEALGAQTLDSWSAVEKVRDKARCASALASRGLPVPPTFLARRPEDLTVLASSLFPLVLKPVHGDNATGIKVIRQPLQLSSVVWDGDLVLAQRYLDTDGIDLKVYVAGEAVWAVRRSSPLAPSNDEAVPASMTRPMEDVVAACREEFGLHLFGLDLLESEDGLVIVDVNEFPNYTGIDDAPAVIGRLLLDKIGSATG